MKIHANFNLLESLSVPFPRETPLIEMSAVHKKVMVAVMVVFALFATGYAIYHYFLKEEEQGQKKIVSSQKKKSPVKVQPAKSQATQSKADQVQSTILQPTKPEPQHAKKEEVKEALNVEPKKADNISEKDEAVQTLNEKIATLGPQEKVSLLMKICPLGRPVEENKKAFARLNGKAVNHLVKAITDSWLFSLIIGQPCYSGLLSDEHLKQLDVSEIAFNVKDKLLNYLFPPRDELIEENKARFALLSAETVKQFSESLGRSPYHQRLLPAPEAEKTPDVETLPKQPESDVVEKIAPPDTIPDDVAEAIAKLNESFSTLDELTQRELLMKVTSDVTDINERKRRFSLLKPETVNGLLMILGSYYSTLLSDEHFQQLDLTGLEDFEKSRLLTDLLPAHDTNEENIRRIGLLSPESYRQFFLSVLTPRCGKLFAEAAIT